jgi:flagellar basal body rod protein FlgG
VTNNLANASTTGFKKDGLTFNDGLIRELAANAGNGGRIGTLGSGSVVQGAYTDFSSGTLTMTGNPLDLALRSSQGAFAVQTPGGVRYTRDGEFQLNDDRQIVDKQGRALLNRQLQPITVTRGKIEIGEDGTVSVDGKDLDQVAVFGGTFRKEGMNLFSSAGAQLLDNPDVVSGSLESSNVNAVEEMIAMIRLNRAFELAQRSVQSQDESTQRLVSSLQGR